jgi:hypothetical protein
MKAHHLLPRHGEEAKGIVVAEVLLQEEREAGHVRERSQVIGVSSAGIEAAAVMPDILVGVPHGPLQSLQLQSPDLIDARPLE